jgi:hypothetical protein
MKLSISKRNKGIVQTASRRDRAGRYELGTSSIEQIPVQPSDTQHVDGKSVFFRASAGNGGQMKSSSSR